MTQLRVLIVDDEPLARARLQRQLPTIENCIPVGEAADIDSALIQVQILDPDLVLLDIEMPGGSGLELAQQLSTRECPPAIIFVPLTMSSPCRLSLLLQWVICSSRLVLNS